MAILQRKPLMTMHKSDHPIILVPFDSVCANKHTHLLHFAEPYSHHRSKRITLTIENEMWNQAVELVPQLHFSLHQMMSYFSTPLSRHTSPSVTHITKRSCDLSPLMCDKTRGDKHNLKKPPKTPIILHYLPSRKIILYFYY